MNITHNGEPRTVVAHDMAAVLDELSYSGATVATALNGEIVHRERRAETRLSDGDALEVVAPMAGG